MKSGYVTLLGRPNVGKSTLMNQLIGQKVAITSDKPQTTRNRIQTVYTDERGQIIFLDTPGMQKAKNKLGEYMVDVTGHSIGDADVILWLVEADEFIGGGDRSIAGQLKNVKKPVIIVVNKADRLRDKKALLPIIAKFDALLPGCEIVPISAEKGSNCDELLKVIFEFMPEGPMYFDEDTVTDQPVKQIAAEMIREKALRFMSEEIPHGVAVLIDRFEWRNDGMYDVDAAIVCEKESHKGIIIGKGGSMLKKIATAARLDIEELTGEKVNLKVWVKVRESWRDSDIQLKNFGYDCTSIK
ncbi:MAG: GTPase Era [Lachnospiraceae bacterium]|nr:GTPase Era [Candidatus Darwinimomas equi]